jgi:hypothetical protein
MSVELQKIREKLEQLKNPKFKTGKFDKKTWSPEKDKAKTIRFVKEPGRADDDPFYELHFHYNMGKSGSILCPRMNSNQPCPICEFAFNLRKSGDAGDLAVFKSLMPKQRFYGLVVDREDPKLQPKWWGFGKEIYMQLLESLLNEDYSNFMDTAAGKDAIVTVVTKAGGKTEYSAPKLVFRPKDTPLATAEKQQEIYNAITPLSEVFKPLTESEITAKLTAWLEFKASDGEELVKSNSGTTESAEEPTNGGNFKDLDDAFEAALKDE